MGSGRVVPDQDISMSLQKRGRRWTRASQLEGRGGGVGSGWDGIVCALLPSSSTATAQGLCAGPGAGTVFGESDKCMALAFLVFQGLMPDS